MNARQEHQGSDDDASSRLASAAQEQSPEEVQQIQRGIEETRAEMSETIDALQQRLSPAYLKEQVKEQVIEQVRQVKDSMRQATIGKVEDMVDRVSDSGRSIGETIRANPIPSALVGIGLAWLWMNRRSDAGRSSRAYDGSYGRNRYGEDRGGYGGAWRDYDDRRFDDDRGRTSEERYGRTSADLGGAAASVAGRASNAVSNAASQVQRKASDLADKASDAISGAVDQAQQKADYIAERAQYQARRVEDTFSQTLNDNPMALGAVALALGTAVGLALPQTRKENELMGATRDSLVDKAQTVAHEAIDHVQQAAQQVTASGSQATGSSTSVTSSPNASL